MPPTSSRESGSLGIWECGALGAWEAGSLGALGVWEPDSLGVCEGSLMFLCQWNGLMGGPRVKSHGFMGEYYCFSRKCYFSIGFIWF